MKSIAMPKIVQVDEEIKKHLLHEVKETLATHVEIRNRKRFTAADMWNVNRKRRTAVDFLGR